MGQQDQSTVVAAQRNGNFYETDTPGPSSRTGLEPFQRGHSAAWRALHGGVGIGYHLEAEIAGVLGSAVDLLKCAVKGLAAKLVLGPFGWTC